MVTPLTLCAQLLSVLGVGIRDAVKGRQTVKMVSRTVSRSQFSQEMRRSLLSSSLSTSMVSILCDSVKRAQTSAPRCFFQILLNPSFRLLTGAIRLSAKALMTAHLSLSPPAHSAVLTVLVHSKAAMTASASAQNTATHGHSVSPLLCATSNMIGRSSMNALLATASSCPFCLRRVSRTHIWTMR